MVCEMVGDTVNRGSLWMALFCSFWSCITPPLGGGFIQQAWFSSFILEAFGQEMERPSRRWVRTLSVPL